MQVILFREYSKWNGGENIRSNWEVFGYLITVLGLLLVGLRIPLIGSFITAVGVISTLIGYAESD